MSLNPFSRFSWLVFGLIGLTLLVGRVATATPQPAADIPWTTPKLISTNSPEGAFVPVLRVAPNSSLMIMYNHSYDTLAINNPYYSTSTNGGANWSQPTAVQNSGLNLSQITFEFDSNSVAHAIWYTNAGIYHAQQSQWPSAFDLIANGSNIIDPDVDISSNNVIHVVWAQGNIQNVYHAYSTNGGSNWTVSPPLDANTDKSSSPSVAVDSSGNVHVVWEERRFDPNIGNFRNEIEYMKATLSGGNYVWDAQPTILSSSSMDAIRPAILIQGSLIHVSFTRLINTNEQYAYHTLYTPGSGWSNPVDTMNGNPLSVNASTPFFLVTTMAYCNNTLYLYFHGSPAFNTREQIWGTSSVANQIWSALDPATGDQIRSVNPSLLCIGNRLHLAYEQIVVATENDQIYYISGVTNLVYLPTIVKP